MPKPTASEELQAAHERTVARLQRITDHLEHSARAGRLKDKVAIITGVGSLTGIGRATAFTFAHHGAKHLYLLDFDETNLPELKESLTKKYPDVKVDVEQCDAADESAITSIISRAMSDEGRLDVFFANAGVATAAPLASTDGEDLLETHRVNTLSCFLAIKHASVAMTDVRSSSGKTDTGGSIILTASVAGLRSGAGSVDYSASKAAVISLAQTSAWQLSRTGVRVNAVCPGLIQTGMTLPAFEMAEQRGTLGKVGQLNPTGRYGISQEIANAVLFLASDESTYVNGVALPVDGGLAAGHPVVPGKFH